MGEGTEMPALSLQHGVCALFLQPVLGDKILLWKENVGCGNLCIDGGELHAGGLGVIGGLVEARVFSCFSQYHEMSFLEGPGGHNIFPTSIHPSVGWELCK